MSVMCNKVINLAQRQVGYKETGTNQTKYARWFDNEAWQWFNTKKQGAEWCAILICWLFAQNEILGKEKARKFLGCPAPKNNLAAGAGYLWGYLCKRGWKIDKKGGLPGDIIFFGSSCGHVGIIEKVDDKKYYTIEGNKSNQVKRCSYSRGSTAIYGICRPAWAEIDPKPEPVQLPADYKVYNTKEFLSLRTGPSNNYKKLGEVYNDAVLTVTEIQDNFGKVTPTLWVNMAYMKKV